MKLKVAYFAFSENYGARHAGFTHSYNMIKSLLGMLNIVAFFSSKKRIVSNLDIYGVLFPSTKTILGVNPLKYFSSYFFVRNSIKDVDLIHERFHINPIELLFVGNKPYILEINDPAMVLHENFFYKFLINLKLKKCDCIITQTETLKDILSKYTNKPIYIVSNGVDTSLFRPGVKNNIREKFNVKKNEVLAVFVGAFMPWHGVMGVAKLAGKFNNVKFLMIGGGPEFDNVKKISFGVRNLILLGPKSAEEIPKYLAAADICLAPFDTKKFSKLDDYGFWWCPVKLFEYIASGKPVLSYDYYEVKNIIKEGGLLAKAGDFNDFTNKFKELINNKKLRIKLGKNARMISLKYDWKYRAKEVYGVYKKCLKK